MKFHIALKEGVFEYFSEAGKRFKAALSKARSLVSKGEDEEAAMSAVQAVLDSLEGEDFGVEDKEEANFPVVELHMSTPKEYLGAAMKALKKGDWSAAMEALDGAADAAGGSAPEEEEEVVAPVAVVNDRQFVEGTIWKQVEGRTALVF